MSFIRIAVTSPEVMAGESSAAEAEIIRTLLSGGEVDYVHLRKPSSRPAMRDLAAALCRDCDEDLRQRLTVHDFFDIAEEFGLGGVHLNSRHPAPPAGWKGRVSASLHSIEELLSLCGGNPVKDLPDTLYDNDYVRYDYVTLSPVYDSISKSGYRSAFDIGSLKSLLACVRTPVIALGGVTPARFGALEDAGFAGAAMLGYYFGNKLTMS